VEGVANIVDFDLSFLGGSAHEDDPVPVYNGTGTCETHHGESDCFADAYNLCAQHEVGVGSLARWWAFTECMFNSQGDLCPESWDGDACGADAYSAAYFDPVVETCLDSAGLSADQGNAIVNCAVSEDHEEMNESSKSLLVNSFQTNAELDPAGKPMWIYVDDKFIDAADYDTPEEWGNAVFAAVCAAYTGDAPPAACS